MELVTAKYTKNPKQGTTQMGFSTTSTTSTKLRTDMEKKLALVAALCDNMGDVDIEVVLTVKTPNPDLSKYNKEAQQQEYWLYEAKRRMAAGLELTPDMEQALEQEKK